MQKKIQLDIIILLFYKKYKHTTLNLGAITLNNKNIPFFNYPYLFEPEEEQLTSIIKNVCKRGAYVLQKDLEEFEQNLAQFKKNMIKHSLLLPIYPGLSDKNVEHVCDTIKQFYAK